MLKVLSSVVAGTSVSSQSARPLSSDSQNIGEQSITLISGAVIKVALFHSHQHNSLRHLQIISQVQKR